MRVAGRVPRHLSALIVIPLVHVLFALGVRRIRLMCPREPLSLLGPDNLCHAAGPVAVFIGVLFRIVRVKTVFLFCSVTCFALAFVNFNALDRIDETVDEIVRGCAL